jgi:hypothetical protein
MPDKPDTDTLSIAQKQPAGRSATYCPEELTVLSHALCNMLGRLAYLDVTDDDYDLGEIERLVRGVLWIGWRACNLAGDKQAGKDLMEELLRTATEPFRGTVAHDIMNDLCMDRIWFGKHNWQPDCAYQFVAGQITK